MRTVCVSPPPPPPLQLLTLPSSPLPSSPSSPPLPLTSLSRPLFGAGGRGWGRPWRRCPALDRTLGHRSTHLAQQGRLTGGGGGGIQEVWLVRGRGGGADSLKQLATLSAGQEGAEPVGQSGWVAGCGAMTTVVEEVDGRVGTEPRLLQGTAESGGALEAPHGILRHHSTPLSGGAPEGGGCQTTRPTNVRIVGLKNWRGFKFATVVIDN